MTKLSQYIGYINYGNVNTYFHCALIHLQNGQDWVALSDLLVKKGEFV